MARRSRRALRVRSRPTRAWSKRTSAGARPPAPAPSMLRLDGLDVYYGEIHALRGVALDVREREIVALLGNNGAGKSTTLKTVSGLLRPRRGTISFEDTPLAGVAPHDIVARGIAHVPE